MGEVVQQMFLGLREALLNRQRGKLTEALKLQSGALTEVGPEQVEVIRLEMTVLENLKRIHTYLKRIAREIVPQEIRG